MKTFNTIGIFVALAWLASAGCVTQQHADDIETQYRKAQEQLVELQAQVETYRAHVNALENAPPKPDQQTLDELANAQATLSQLEAELAAARNRMKEMESRPTPLPAELNKELAEFAQAHPQLMAYDESLGMVKLSSDLTFDSGSDVVNSGATAGLTQLAEIFNSPIAIKYEVRIVGHTDNVRIAKESTRDHHPTNWHLSAHRSIAVKDVLTGAGLAAVRVNVSGYGEHRPIVANSRRGNRTNRRVEIFLVPYTYQTIVSTPYDESETVAEVGTIESEDPAEFK